MHTSNEISTILNRDTLICILLMSLRLYMGCNFGFARKPMTPVRFVFPSRLRLLRFYSCLILLLCDVVRSIIVCLEGNSYGRLNGRLHGRLYGARGFCSSSCFSPLSDAAELLLLAHHAVCL